MNESINLHACLDADLISVRSKISSRKKLLQEISTLLASPLTDNSDVKTKDVYHHLLEREKLGNTGVGNGVALPHSRFALTDKAIVAIITLDEPIDYDSIDRQGVDVAFGLLVPENANQEHLNILAEIAKFLSFDGNKKALLACKNATQIMNLVETWSKQGN